MTAPVYFTSAGTSAVLLADRPNICISPMQAQVMAKAMMARAEGS
jgi:hypothetical protein